MLKEFLKTGTAMLAGAAIGIPIYLACAKKPDPAFSPGVQIVGNTFVGRDGLLSCSRDVAGQMVMTVEHIYSSSPMWIEMPRNGLMIYDSINYDDDRDLILNGDATTYMHVECRETDKAYSP